MQYTDFNLGYADGALVIPLAPPANIAGWTLQYSEYIHRYGSGLNYKYCASGYGDGVSGITVTNSGAGIVSISLPDSDLSGRPSGAYYFELDRIDSGMITPLAGGFRVIA